MPYLKLIKYPGAKTALLPQITEIYARSGCKIFVDVFGGSGAVSLNVDSQHTIYNDLNPDLVNLFEVVRRTPEGVTDFLSSFLEEIERKSDGIDSASFNDYIRKDGGLVLDKVLSSHGNRDNEEVAVLPENADFKKAMRTLFNLSTSFGGMGNTYGTSREKSVFRYLEKTMEIIFSVQRRAKSWEIRNLDFRELMTRYDSGNAFFYLDPPYPGKGWYDYNFGRKDFEDISSLLRKIRGKYLMSLDFKHDGLLDIFGPPSFTEEYSNMNGRPEGRIPKRKKLFYTNVELNGQGSFDP